MGLRKRLRYGLQTTSSGQPSPPPVVSGPISSAGVFGSNGVLVRTIWSAQVNDPRVNNPMSAWDGTLDDGSVAPTGIYTVQRLTHNVTYTWDGVIGNTSPNHSNVSLTPVIVGGNQAYIYTGYHSYGGCINDMAITAAGEMYFVTGYDERMNVYHVATTADPQHANGITSQGFRSTWTDTLNVCSDGTIAYFHFWDSGGNAAFNGIFGINCSTKHVVSFPSGTGSFQSGNFCLTGNNNFILGITVQQSHNLVIAGRGGVQGPLSTSWFLSTSDKTTGAFLKDNSLGFAFQSRLCVDPVTDHPWVCYLKETAAASATFDPQNSSTLWTFSNGNLTIFNGPNASIYAYSNGHGTKIYFEVVLNASGQTTAFGAPIGVASSLGGRNSQGFLGFDAASAAFYGNGSYGGGGVNVPSGLPTWGIGDNVGIACDAPNSLIWFRVNGGQWNGSPTANPATGIGGISTGTLGSPIVAAVAVDTVAPNTQLTANFASGSWAFSAPAGFSGLPGVTRAATVSKLNFDNLGNLTDSGVAATAGLVSAGACAVSPDGLTLLVVDGGASQQIKAFNTSDGSVKTAWGTSGTLGDAGGYANGPAVSNHRFMFGSNLGFSGTGGWITYVSDGSFWFADAGNCRYLHFSAGNSPTYIEQIAYFPGFYAAGVCGNDDTRVFGGYLEFKIDYSKTLAPGNGSWTLVNNWFFGVPGGFTGDQAMRYAATGSNSRTYIPVGPQHAVAFYEMTSAGYRQASPLNVLFDYVDRNFNLWAINGGGTGQAAQFCVNRFTGFDGSQNLTWQSDPTIRPSNVVVTSATFTPTFPELHTDPNRSNIVETLANGVIPVFNVHGQPASNPLTQYHLGGINSTTGALQFITHPPQNGNSVGGLGFYPPPPAFCINLGANNNSVDEYGVGDNAGAFQAFVPGTSDIFTIYRGESWSANQVLVGFHWHQSGLLINRFGGTAPYFQPQGLSTLINPPVLSGPNFPALNLLPSGDYMPMNQTFGFMGTPGLAGNVSSGGIAFENGNYYLYHPDEWYHGGVHRWKVSNLNTIQLVSQAISWNSSSYAPPTLKPYNFLSGLPYNTANLPNGSGGWTRNPTIDNATPSNYSFGPWYRVMTNGILYERGVYPDLFFENNNSSTAATTSISYSWTRVGFGNWSLTGVISQKGLGQVFFPNVTGQQHLYIDVLDGSGNKILRMENISKANFSPSSINGVMFWINGNPLSTPLGILAGGNQSAADWNAWISIPQPLVITANVGAGTMTVSYAGYTLTGITVNDVGADIAHPAQFMVTYTVGPAAGVNRFSFDILAMQFADG